MGAFVYFLGRELSDNDYMEIYEQGGNPTPEPEYFDMLFYTLSDYQATRESVEDFKLINKNRFKREHRLEALDIAYSRPSARLRDNENYIRYEMSPAGTEWAWRKRRVVRHPADVAEAADRVTAALRQGLPDFDRFVRAMKSKLWDAPQSVIDDERFWAIDAMESIAETSRLMAAKGATDVILVSPITVYEDLLPDDTPDDAL